MGVFNKYTEHYNNLFEYAKLKCVVFVSNTDLDEDHCQANDYRKQLIPRDLHICSATVANLKPSCLAQRRAYRV